MRLRASWKSMEIERGEGFVPVLGALFSGTEEEVLMLSEVLREPKESHFHHH